MSEGMTCYERDEDLCEDQMCLRVGCRLRNERLAPSQAMTDNDLPAELEHYAKRAMPHYPNDICSRAKAEIERLRLQLVQAHEALISIRSNANCHTADLALATMPLIFDIATRTARALAQQEGREG